jgi:sec-independent protein translocase protein TatB
MFDIGWTEMLVIAVVMIVVVGPKDLPRMLRTFGKTTAKLRAMAGDFQKQFNEALKEAELDDVKKSVDELRSLNPANEIRKQLNPFEKAAADVRAGLNNLKSPPPAAPADPASPVTHPAEPLKNGATEMPGVNGPDTMPPAPLMQATNGAAASPAVSPDPAIVAAAPAATPVKKAKIATAKTPKPKAEPAGEAPATAVATKTPTRAKSAAVKKTAAAKAAAKNTKAPT